MRDTLEPYRIVVELPSDAAAAQRALRALREAYSVILKAHTPLALTDYDALGDASYAPVPASVSVADASPTDIRAFIACAEEMAGATRSLS